MSDNSEKKNLHAGHRERVKRNACENGFSQLEEHKLLELLLFYAIPQKDTNELAHRLLEEFGSLGEVITADVARLKRVSGVGESTAVMLSAIGEVHRRSSKRTVNRRVFKTKEAIRELVLCALENEPNETAVVFCFDKEYRLKRQTVICRGNEFSANFESRKIISAVMESEATFAVLSHNHPIGSASPSGSDIDSTRAVSVMLRNLGYVLADHLIVSGEGEVYSMHSDPRFTQLFY